MPTSSSSELELPDLPETPDTTGAYPRLTDEQIMLLSRYGERKRAGQGHHAVLRGGPRLRLVRRAGRPGPGRPGGQTPRESRGCIAVHGPGRFVGDLSMLTGQAVYVTAVAQTDVEVLEVPYDRLKEAVTQDQALGDLILRAFILRRNIHADLGAGLRIIGSRYSADTRRLRDFASRNRIPYRWEDVEEDPEAEVTLRAFDIPPDQTPVVIWKGQTVLRNPSNTELAELLGLRAAPSRDGVRPGRGRRRPGRSGRSGLRRLRGALDGRPGRLRHRRAGGHVVPDRELPGVPRRHLRRRAGRPRRGPGPQVRRRLHIPGEATVPRRRPTATTWWGWPTGTT